jgi:tetratricopeptide (TPR) repeat protein
MRRLAVIAGCMASGLLPGCAALHDRAEQAGLPSEQTAYCQQLSQTAQVAIDRQDWGPACTALEQLVNAAPKSPEAQHRLGRVLLALGRLPQAETAFLRALALDPEYIEAMIGLAETEYRMGRPWFALKQIETAVEIDPHRPEAHVAQGRVLEALHKPDEALAAYFRALDLEPNTTEALVRVATLQLGRGQADQALARLSQVLEITPDDAEARYQRGRAHLALGHGPTPVDVHVAQSLDDLKWAARHLPNRPDVFYHLALALKANNQATDALQAADRAVQLAPEWANARDLSRDLRR